MERYFRLCRLHQLLLSQRRPATRRAIEQDLACSSATAKRVLKELRDLTCDPIPYDRALGGYRYQAPALHDRDLPFLWFTAPELNALLVVGEHLDALQTGLLREALRPLRERVQSLLSLHGESGQEARRRIRILPQAQRTSAEWFPLCAEAVLQRQRLRIVYAGRNGNGSARRDISPQWHPRQQGRFLEDGRYQLTLPYSDPTELVMDILREGPEVEVIAPEDLQQTVIRRLREALAGYGG